MMNLTRKKLTIGFIAIMAILLPVILIVASRRQDTRSGASNPITISITPGSGSHAVGEDITAKLMITAGENNVAYAKVNIRFDSSKVILHSFTMSDKFDEALSAVSISNPSPGVGNLSVELINTGQAPNKGTIEIGTFKIQGKAAAVGNGTITIDPALTEVYDAGNTQILQVTTTNPGIYTITGTQTGGPTATPSVPQPVSVGPKDPTVITQAPGSAGNGTWSGIDNVKVSDNQKATVSLENQNAGANVSKPLIAKGFGFNIPAGATINGIKVEVEKNPSSMPGVADEVVSLTKDGTTAVGDNLKESQWYIVEQYKTYGSESYRWEASWTPEEINSPNFGLVFAARSTGAAAVSASVDHIRITVNYTPATVAATPSVTITPSLTITPSVTPTCTDTDGGINYNVKSGEDFCYSGSGSPENPVLIEYFCHNGEMTNASYNCPGGCSNGKCNSTTPLPTGTVCQNDSNCSSDHYCPANAPTWTPGSNPFICQPRDNTNTLCPKKNQGDFTCNGTIGFDDLFRWRDEYISGTGTTADVVAPTGVGFEDLFLWRDTYISQ